MSSQSNVPEDFLRSIPSDLPVPIDDGACAHLEGQSLPKIELPSTEGVFVNPFEITGWLVIFCYPMTGRPGRPLPSGWIDIPGAAARLRLPYPLLSDAAFKFSDSLKLPLLAIENLRLIKRLTLIAKEGVIEKCFYPVFPPDKNVKDVIKWFSKILE